MSGGLAGAWERFWFRPASALGPIAVRALLCANALWIVLSRPDLPELPAWPVEMWARVTPALRFRYLIPPSGGVGEHAAYWILVVALAAGMLGFVPRFACLAAAGLLYHFAPFEEILTTSNGPYLGGLTLPLLGLLVLSSAPRPTLGSEASPENRWPVALVRVLLAFSYLFAGVAKLASTGSGWMSADNIEATALLFMTYEARPAWGHWLVDHRALAVAAGVGIVTFELLFISALFSRRAAAGVMVAGLAFHVFLYGALGLALLNAPLLFILVDWDSVEARWRARRERREPLPPVA